MKGENPVDCIENKKIKNEKRKTKMSKLLVLILKVMTGFIFIVAFVEAVKLAVQGIKSLIGMMRLGRRRLKDWSNEKREQYRIKREQKRQEKLNRKVNEATGA